MSISSPVSFARGLADPLQPNRLKALSGLNAWMAASGASHEFTPVEIDQLWRALQYTMWMADKRPVQQQVAAEIVLLVRKIDPRYVTEWNRGFWFNLEKIYETIDKYRIPKFHLFIRIYVAEMLHQMQQRNWDAEFVGACVDGILSNLKKSVGAYIQLLTVLIPELTATVGEDIRGVIKKAETFRMLLKPAVNVVSKSADFPFSVVSKAVSEVLSNEKVIKYTAKTREWVRGEMQSVAMNKETSQEVRDLLYSALDSIKEMVEVAADVGGKNKNMKKKARIE